MLDSSFMNVFDLISAHAANFALKPAVMSDDAAVSWANARLGKHRRLGSAVFWEDHPRNAPGKPVKRQMRDDFLRSFKAEEEIVQ